MPETRLAAVLPDSELSGGDSVKPTRGNPLLTARVHIDALIGAPARYAKAVWWCLCGKRQRARSILEPLLGMSAHAYQLWVARAEEPRKRSAEKRVMGEKIVAIVEVPQGAVGLEQTLRSLGDEGIAAVMLRSGDGAGLGAPMAGSLAELAGAIDWDQRPWLLPICAGDVLAAGAGALYAAAAARSQARIVYADDDLLDERGKRIAPHFKPDWNSELYRHFDYMSGACIVQAQKDEMLSVEGSADWRRDLISGIACEHTPEHVHHVLHHRRGRPAPKVPVTPATLDKSLPPVTVVVPTRNRVDLLKTCLSGLDAAKYPNLKVIVVDNGSDDPAALAYLDGLNGRNFSVLRHDGPFNFAAINNRAVRQAVAPMLCFLNNDIEVIGPDWLPAMVMQAMRDDVGAVGAQLLYPDGRTQHAGVVLGVKGGTAHAHRLLKPSEEGYFWRHQLPQFASAVTAACMVVQRDRFLAVGGFDEENFAVAFNDVDLCMRLNRRGWQTLYEPRAQLVHHESVSRGSDRDPVGARRLAGEMAALNRRWGTDRYVDPYHHPNLSRFSERFVVAL